MAVSGEGVEERRAGQKYLGPDAEVRVGHELGPLVLVLRLQVAVEHAHGHAGQRHHERQDLPRAGWAGAGQRLIGTSGLSLALMTRHY